MAQIIPCDGSHPEPTAAVFLVTMITEAETMGLCAGCMCDWSQALLTELAPERLAPPPAKTPNRPRRPARSRSTNPDNSELATAGQDASG